MSKRIYTRPVNFINLIGVKKGLLTVLSESTEFTRKGRVYWNCICDCGNTKVVSSHGLNKDTKSCGCLIVKSIKERSTIHGSGSKSSEHYNEYCSWAAMKARCYNEKTIQFCDYGGRGITVCDRWLNSFDNFLEDMGKRPTKKHSIDRIDNNGNYEPNNCRWATQGDQRRNTSRSNILSFNGKSMVITDWANLFQVSPSSISKHLKKGKSFDEIYDMYMNKERSKEWKKYHNKTNKNEL
jgi:hypothetical protein